VFPASQLHYSLFDPSEAVETMQESCKAALPGSAKPAFRGQELSSLLQNPGTFLAFTSCFYFGRLIFDAPAVL
jgi:hypothetical protein